MNDTDADNEVQTIVLRWPAWLIAEVDDQAKADRRSRNTWLELKVTEILEHAKTT